jgi:hypothetical protein
MTGLDFIKAALRRCGVLAAGETPEADDGAHGLACLNRMLGILIPQGRSRFLWPW